MSNIYDDDRDYDDDEYDEDDDDCDDDDDTDDDEEDDEELSPPPRIRTRVRAPRLKKSMSISPIKSKSGNSTVQLIAEAIQAHEGWILPGRGYPRGSRSYRNNNPGNLKFIGQRGSVGADTAGFAIFPSFELGWNALLSDLNAKFKRNPSLSIAGLVHIYAPSSDGNNELAYVNAINSHINANV